MEDNILRFPIQFHPTRKDRNCTRYSHFGMRRSSASSLSILCFLSLSLILLVFFFSFSLSLRVAAFFMFNSISLTIFLGRPNAGEVEGEVSMPLLSEEDGNNWDGSDMEDDVEGYHGYDGYDEDNDDDLNTADIDSEDDDDDDDDQKDRELERTEEFIAKVTAKWREEFLMERLLLYITDSSS